MTYWRRGRVFGRACEGFWRLFGLVFGFAGRASTSSAARLIGDDERGDLPSRASTSEGTWSGAMQARVVMPASDDAVVVVG